MCGPAAATRFGSGRRTRRYASRADGQLPPPSPARAPSDDPFQDSGSGKLTLNSNSHPNPTTLRGSSQRRIPAVQPSVHEPCCPSAMGVSAQTEPRLRTPPSLQFSLCVIIRPATSSTHVLKLFGSGCGLQQQQDLQQRVNNIAWAVVSASVHASEATPRAGHLCAEEGILALHTGPRSPGDGSHMCVSRAYLAASDFGKLMTCTLLPDPPAQRSASRRWLAQAPRVDVSRLEPNHVDKL